MDEDFNLKVWLPISGAERTAQYRLLMNRDGRVFVGHFYQKEVREFGEVTDSVEGWFAINVDNEVGRKLEPTHWTEIPEFDGDFSKIKA